MVDLVPTRTISTGICLIKTTSVYEKMFLIMARTHGSLVSKGAEGGRERGTLPTYEKQLCMSVSKPILALYFETG